jgi:hypothetical protein
MALISSRYISNSTAKISDDNSQIVDQANYEVDEPKKKGKIKGPNKKELKK